MTKSMKEESEETKDQWMSFTIRMTKFEYDKLVALAEFKTMKSKGRKTVTVTECIRVFAQTCVTDGGGWKDPNTCASEYEAKKHAEKQSDMASGDQANR